jgi:hypothetical protein
VLIPVLLLFAPSAQAATAVYPQFSISIAPGTMELNASYYDREVTLEGTLIVDNPSGTEVDFIIVARDSGQWGVSCSQGILTVRGSGSESFVLTMEVPARACNRTVEVWVDGEARLNGIPVGTNQSPRAQVILGHLPRGPEVEHRDGSWMVSTFGAAGPVPLSLVVVVVVAAGRSRSTARAPAGRAPPRSRRR